ncbi:carboxypeptidase-like regulatory domain-containing protein [Winogradskyella litorisediminis]|uniref:Carboxypeptidase-like regulatory domain-containing protein n=1 Tax=Winogradskyella litorisediminis TaxID=1156618 RepID=A0ABW3N675_9FLAO
MIKKISLILILVSTYSGFAQLQNLNGIVIANDEVEGVHVLNKSSVKYTVTDTDGSFTIIAKANDTLVFSALKYKLKETVVTASDLQKSDFKVYLEEKINELDEVTVGKILTGSLGSDLGNVETKEELNFYDLGIPGYTGKPKTIEERKLADADAGSWGYVGIGFSINFHKLLNKVSGRTKKLKAIVALSENDKCMNRLKDFYTETLFKEEDLTEAQQNEYFYFCMDDDSFKDLCERNDPSEVIPFLNEKLAVYKANLNESKN